jgi:hypothetical protein
VPVFSHDRQHECFLPAPSGTQQPMEISRKLQLFGTPTKMLGILGRNGFPISTPLQCQNRAIAADR